MADRDDTHSLTTALDWCRYIASTLNRENVAFGHGYENAVAEAMDMVAAACHLLEDFPQDFWQARLTTDEIAWLKDTLHKRTQERTPLAYLLGKARFAERWFKVSADTLIPRSPLQQVILDMSAEAEPTFSPTRVLDLCCGTGCIGLAAAYHWARVEELVLADVSEAALSVARENAANFADCAEIAIVQSDGLTNIHGTFDAIFCNPPYVPTADWQGLPAEYHHEPKLGLASGSAGLDFLERWLAECAAHLNPGGTMFVDVGLTAPAFLARFADMPWQPYPLDMPNHGIYTLTP